MKRALPILMAVILLFSPLTVTAFADGDNSHGNVTRYSVLILDVSGSMWGTPLAKEKEAATKFCESVLAADGENYVALVMLDSNSYVGVEFTKDLETLTNYIDGLYDNGTTDTNGALELADELLKGINTTGVIKNIVLCSDGLPCDGKYDYNGPYTSDDYYDYEYANSAYNTAVTLKELYSVYTLGFFHSLSGSELVFGRKLMLDLQNAGYYEVTDPNELEFRFGEVADDLTNDNGLKKISFTYGGGDKATCYYSNDYFSESSYTYKQSLGTMSLAFAMSAFGNDSEPYTNKSVNAKNLLMGIGVPEKNIATNDWFTVKPTTDSIGVVAGNMPIKVNDSDYTLIALAVRGGGYEQEWASNFTIGTSGQHDGFDTAKENVLSFLRDYIKAQKITGPVKIWITGYSRAAATSNLVGGAIDNGAVLSTDISYELGDVYTYCFETPAGALTSQVKNQSVYNNIYNIINSSDPVPYVAPAAMGFGRYGIDKYLPSKESDSNYYSKRSAMLSVLGSLDNNNTYIVDDFQMKKLGIDANVNWDWFNTSVDWTFIFDDTDNNFSQGTFLSNYVTILSKDFIKNRSNYVAVYQDEIREICSVVFGCTSEQSKAMMDSIVSQAKDNWGALAWSYVYNTGVRGLFPWNWNDKSAAEREDAALQIISDWLNNAIKDAGITNYNDAMIDRAGKDIGDLALALVSNHPNYFTTAIINGSGLGAAHYPELCFAWMASMDDNYSKDNVASFNTGSYRIIRINCEVDVAVYDESGNVVASIVNETPQVINGSSLISAINEDGEKIVILPIDTTYDIRITGREDDTVDYGIDEYCALAGDFTRAVDYFDVGLLRGQSLTGNIPAYSVYEISDDTQLINGSTAVYTLRNTDNALISSDSELSGDEASDAYYTVNVLSADDSAGIALGSGVRQYGNYAQIEAYANEGYGFSGWYENGTKVSSDDVYRFRVTQDVDIKAHFDKKETCTITFDSNGHGTAPVAQIVEYGKIATKPDNPTANGWMFNGWYMEAACVNAFDFATPIVSDIILYAKWTEIGIAPSPFPLYPVVPVIPEIIPVTPTEHMPSTSSQEPEVPFTDVSPDSPFYDNIQYVYTNGLIIGMSETEFGENLPLTRGMIVTILHRMEGEPGIPYSGVFADVPNSQWYTDGVEWAASVGIVLGYGDGTYGVTDNVSREQLATILFRYAKYKGFDVSISEDTNILSYDDAFGISDWAISAMQWACGTDVLNSGKTAAIRPTDAATRGEIAHAIHVFCESVAK